MLSRNSRPAALLLSALRNFAGLSSSSSLCRPNIASKFGKLFPSRGPIFVMAKNGVFGRCLTGNAGGEVGRGVYGDTCDGDDDGDSGSESCGDDVEGERKLGKVVDEELEKKVEVVMEILRGFGSDKVKARSDLDRCGVPASPELAEQVLSRVRNDWEAAFTFFLWAQKQPGYSHSLREYHTMIAILGKMRRFDTAWSVIDEMRKSGMVNPRTLLILIRKYAAVHDVGKAIGTFYALKRYGFPIGLEEFNALLGALCRYKNVQEAEHLLLSDENMFPLDVKSFNIVLNGWCNLVVSVREARRFWFEMGKRGVCRDAVSYGSLMSCYSKAGSLRDVMKLFDRMKEEGIAPDRKVYNAVVFALAKGKCVKEAIALMKTMDEKGCAPNSVTYNSIIKPLCRARKLIEAKSLFDEMLRRGLSPSIRTYHAFLSIAKTVEESLELVKKMTQTGCPPTPDTYIMLIRKFCRWRQCESAYRIWDEMRTNGPSPDRSAYIVFIHGLFLNSRLQEAHKFYEEMKEKGFAPEPRTDEMLGAYAASKKTMKDQMTELANESVDRKRDRKNHDDHTRPQRDRKNHDDHTRLQRNHFIKNAETRNVTRERGFSLW